MPQMQIDDLNRLYLDSEQVDKELYAEQRNNVLLVAGEHFTKNSNKYFARLRETNRLSEEQKLRLTKNHQHRIARTYENSILSKAPGVQVVPNNKTEMQDQKTAELNDKVWKDAKRRYKLKDKFRSRCKDFVGIGECAHKIFWNEHKGEVIGYEVTLDEEGNPVVDEYGEDKPDVSKPVYSGAFEFEPIFGFNLLRSSTAKSMEESRYLGIRKMVNRNDLLKIYSGDEEKRRFIVDSEDKTYVVFDTNQVNYNRTEKEVLVKEFYFRPCLEYPNGYYYYFTEEGILEEGELPFGIFPIAFAGFDEHPTSPRGRSILKVTRPYQVEINRAASQMATHQITLGDDKVLYQSGTKLAPGALLPGVRGVTYQGTPPTILPGRDGSQYMAYIEQQTREMYRAAMLDEIDKPNSETNGLDPYALLFRSAKQQQAFAQYSEKFERFLADTCEIFLGLARHYYDDEMLMEIIGYDELDNITEFRRAGKLSYQIQLEEQTDSVDTQLGKQITFTHMLQYVGKSLDKDQIGMIMRQMPYVNNDEIFSEMTVDYDNARNDMLAMERGEQPTINQYMNNEYYVKMLTHRMKQPDFKYLRPEIQQLYQQYLQIHEQEIAKKAQAMKDAQNEYIPVGGSMITCSMHVPDPDNPGSTKQVRVPYQALDWLVKTLEKQGASLEKLEDMNSGAQAELAQMITQPQTPEVLPPDGGFPLMYQ